MGIQTSLWMGCPIRILKDLCVIAAPLERFAGLRVLLRPEAPRHPPRTLSNLCLAFSLFDCSLPLLQLCFFSLNKIEVIYSMQLFRYSWAELQQLKSGKQAAQYYASGLVIFLFDLGVLDRLVGSSRTP